MTKYEIEKVKKLRGDQYQKDIDALNKIKGLAGSVYLNLSIYGANYERIRDKLEMFMSLHKNYIMFSLHGSGLSAIIDKEDLYKERIEIRSCNHNVGFIIGRKGSSIKVTCASLREEYPDCLFKNIDIKPFMAGWESDYVLNRVKEFVLYIESLNIEDLKIDK